MCDVNIQYNMLNTTNISAISYLTVNSSIYSTNHTVNVTVQNTTNSGSSLFWIYDNMTTTNFTSNSFNITLNLNKVTTSGVINVFNKSNFNVNYVNESLISTSVTSYSFISNLKSAPNSIYL